VEAEDRWNLQDKFHLQDREEINFIATHSREIVPQDRRNNRRRQVKDQVRHRWREECIQVNLDLRYVKWSILNTFYLIIASEGRSQGRTKPRKKRCCIRRDHESTPACKGQKDD
jgi:hypothetical protein